MKKIVQEGRPYRLGRILYENLERRDIVGFFSSFDGKTLEGFGYEPVLRPRSVEWFDTDARTLHVEDRDYPALLAVGGSKRLVTFDLNWVEFEPIGELFYIKSGEREEKFRLFLHGVSLALQLQHLQGMTHMSCRHTVTAKDELKRTVSLRPQQRDGRLTIDVEYSDDKKHTQSAPKRAFDFKRVAANS